MEHIRAFQDIKARIEYGLDRHLEGRSGAWGFADALEREQPTSLTSHLFVVSCPISTTKAFERPPVPFKEEVCHVQELYETTMAKAC